MALTSSSSDGSLRNCDMHSRERGVLSLMLILEIRSLELVFFIGDFQWSGSFTVLLDRAVMMYLKQIKLSLGQGK
jgi:hypothetical protein